MPGLKKHVHFDDNSSPASSSSSLPSSRGPVTPPPHDFDSPYHSISPSDNAYINPILSPNSPSLLDYDISLHPTSMKQYMSVSKSVWEQPATHPEASKMVVVCDRLPWVLTISPVDSQKRCVTVGDFVHGLYTALRQSVSNTEFSTLPLAGQTAVTNAYASRCKNVFDADQYDAELMKGVKRVDFLMKHTRFAGIKIGKGGRWNLMIR